MKIKDLFAFLFTHVNLISLISSRHMERPAIERVTNDE